MVIDPAKGVSFLLDEVSQSVAAANLDPGTELVARAAMSAIVLRACGASAERLAVSMDLLDAAIEYGFMRVQLKEMEAGRRPNLKFIEAQTEAHLLKVRGFVAQVGELRRAS